MAEDANAFSNPIVLLDLQEIADHNFLHVSMDVFLGMMPKRMFGHPNDA